MASGSTSSRKRKHEIDWEDIIREFADIEDQDDVAARLQEHISPAAYALLKPSLQATVMGELGLAEWADKFAKATANVSTDS